MLHFASEFPIPNPKAARSQVIGAMTMGVGAALMEELVVDRRVGIFVNHDLASYEVPVHADIPHQDVIFLDETDPASAPMKAKGVAELGICESRPLWRMRSTTRPAYACASTRLRWTSSSTDCRALHSWQRSTTFTHFVQNGISPIADLIPLTIICSNSRCPGKSAPSVNAAGSWPSVVSHARPPS